ncbi:MAG: PepSY domain-containing protein [Asticcacaulis sp.]
MSNEQAVRKSKRGVINYRMIWRWHFYAGLFCIPFVIILSLTGPIYLFKPQIEAAIDRPYDALSGQPKSLEAQVKAALASLPHSQFVSVDIRQNANDAARVTLMQHDERVRVYVHPESLTILKTVKEKDRFFSIVKNIHGELTMGEFGTLIVETAASWALIMIVTGLYLWWPRQTRGLAGVFWPRTGLGRKIFWRDLHGVVGIYVSAFAIILILTGLPWTNVWGSNFRNIRQAIETHQVQADWSTGRAAEKAANKGHHGWHSAPLVADLSHIDIYAQTVRDLKLPPPVVLTSPTERTPHWQGVSQTQNRPKGVTVRLDAHTGAVVSRETFADKKVVDKVVGTGISLHEGQLFGPLNQLIGVLTALGLITLCVSAMVMWWQRRPDDQTLGVPAALPEEGLGPGFGILIVALGLFLPMMGITLIVMALIDFLVLKRIPPVRKWLGLR